MFSFKFLILRFISNVYKKGVFGESYAFIEWKPLSFSRFVLILSQSSSLGHERPYSCVDLKGSTSKELTDMRQSELTSSESTNKHLTTRESTKLSISGEDTMLRKEEESVQYAVFCSPSHQTCGQGDDTNSFKCEIDQKQINIWRWGLHGQMLSRLKSSQRLPER